MALPPQSSPGFVSLDVPTPLEWNGYFEGKIDTTSAGIPNGVAPLDGNSMVPVANVPLAPIAAIFGVPFWGFFANRNFIQFVIS